MANMFDVIQDNIDRAEVSKLPVSCKIEEYIGVSYIEVNFTHRFTIHGGRDNQKDAICKLHDMLYNADAAGKISLDMEYTQYSGLAR